MKLTKFPFKTGNSRDTIKYNDVTRKRVPNIRHRASTSMYSLTFHVRVTTPHSIDEMERPRCR